MDESFESLEEKVLSHSLTQRAALMSQLLNGYEMYQSMQDCRELIGIDINYKSAEMFSAMVEEHLGVECKVTDLLLGKDVLANKSVEKYQQLQEYINNAFLKEFHGTVMAFYKHIYHLSQPSFITMSQTRMCLQAVNALLLYVMGNYTKEDLRNDITSINPAGLKHEVIDSMYVRKLLMELESIFYEIYEKRDKRREAKEDPYEPCEEDEDEGNDYDDNDYNGEDDNREDEEEDSVL